MTAETTLQLVLGHIGSFHNNLIPYHIRRGTGRSNSKYSSVIYSALGFAVTSISIGYFLPNLGIICLKFFHAAHMNLKLVGLQKVNQRKINAFCSLRIQEHDGGNAFNLVLFQQLLMEWIAALSYINFYHDETSSACLATSG